MVERAAGEVPSSPQTPEAGARQGRALRRLVQTGMQLYDAEGRRLYFSEDERRAFVAAAAKAPREVRTLFGVLHATGCRISEALALTAQQIDLSGRVVVFESLKKRRKGIYGVTGRYVQNCTLTGHAEDRCLWVRFWKRVLKGESRDLPSGVNPHAQTDVFESP